MSSMTINNGWARWTSNARTSSRTSLSVSSLSFAVLSRLSAWSNNSLPALVNQGAQAANPDSVPSVAITVCIRGSSTQALSKVVTRAEPSNRGRYFDTPSSTAAPVLSVRP
ncbi:hypothetical protein D3C85_1286160 [compost metagenome]